MPQEDDSDSDPYDKNRYEAQKALLIQAYEKIQKTLDELTTTQDRLIGSEKFALLGEMMAGVAHEIKGPLNAIVASQQTIDLSLQKLCNSAFELGKESSSEEKMEITRFIESLPKNEIFSRIQKSSESKDSYYSHLVEQGFDKEQSHQLAAALATLPISTIEQADKLLKHRNALSALLFSRDFVRITTATWISETSAIKSRKLVESLRDYTYDSKGNVSQVSLKDSVETILAIYQADLIDMDITKSFRGNPSIMADPDRVSQVWSNLLSNALQASGKKGKLDLSIYTENDKAIFSIRDYAGGIPKKIRARIFDPFFTTKPKGQGTGLGLSIIKRIIEDHDGEISVVVEENVSTEIIVTFKLK